MNTCSINNCKCIGLIAEHYSEKQQEVRRKKKRICCFGISVIEGKEGRCKICSVKKIVFDNICGITSQKDHVIKLKNSITFIYINIESY